MKASVGIVMFFFANENDGCLGDIAYRDWRKILSMHLSFKIGKTKRKISEHDLKINVKFGTVKINRLCTCVS